MMTDTNIIATEHESMNEGMSKRRKQEKETKNWGLMEDYLLWRHVLFILGNNMQMTPE